MKIVNFIIVVEANMYGTNKQTKMHAYIQRYIRLTMRYIHFSDMRHRMHVGRHIARLRIFIQH